MLCRATCWLAKSGKIPHKLSIYFMSELIETRGTCKLHTRPIKQETTDKVTVELQVETHLSTHQRHLLHLISS